MRLLRAGQRGAPPLNCGVRRNLMRDKGPPLILDCAVVLAYALHGEAARYTGRGATYHAGRLVGPDIKRSAICRNLGAPYDYLFFYCGDDWSVEAAVGHDTLEEARAYAARMYAGIEDVIVQMSPSQADIETALDAYWEGKRCSRCGKWPHEVERFEAKADGLVCGGCA